MSDDVRDEMIRKAAEELAALLTGVGDDIRALILNEALDEIGSRLLVERQAPPSKPN